MNRPKLLDLFCGEGGASEGYRQAGFEVFGVDSDPQRLKAYPYDSLEADWFDGMQAMMAAHRFDAIHASPPCTGYSRGTAAVPDRITRYDRLIAVVRETLRDTRLPFIIENVQDARQELRAPVMLCGRMFNLSTLDDDGTYLVLDRHRLFECYGFMPLVPDHEPHDRSLQVAGAYAGARRDKVEAREVRKGGYVPPNVEVQRKLLRAPGWMSERGIQLSIPPDYSRFLGTQLLLGVLS